MTSPRTVMVDTLMETLQRVPMPGAVGPVELARLYFDPHTNTNTSVVHFPVGWFRAEAGHYAVAEQFIVLSGGIIVSHECYGAGSFVHLPPEYLRRSTETPRGCVALATFFGRPEWRTGAVSTQLVAETPTVVRIDLSRASPPLELLPGLWFGTPRVGSRIVALEVFSPATRQWWLIEPDEPVPELPTPVVYRWWPMRPGS